MTKTIDHAFEYQIFKDPQYLYPGEGLELEVFHTGPTKNLEKKSHKVLFVGDSYRGGGDDLLAKMIQAMKLLPDEFERLSLADDLLLLESQVLFDGPFDELMSHKSVNAFRVQVFDLNPTIIVSLGAFATNLLLGRREKMSLIHGTFFEREFNGQIAKVIPIFHPEYLMINPNMKKTAWVDLQQVMAILGKN